VTEAPDVAVPREDDPLLADLGFGHGMWFAGWYPDRELNPQYADLPDVEKCTVVIRHELVPGDEHQHCQARGYCEAAANLDSEVTRRIFPEASLWQVDAWDPLTLTPSLRCHCGDHGFIREGHWVPA
jgi:hypothetical protein